MNVKKGLFRFWLVAAIVWMLLSALQSLQGVIDYNTTQNWAFGELIPLTFEDYRRAALTAVSLPIFTLFLYFILKWIVGGFRK